MEGVFFQENMKKIIFIGVAKTSDWSKIELKQLLVCITDQLVAFQIFQSSYISYGESLNHNIS